MPSPDDLVPLLGSSSFIPALHAYLRSSSTANLPLDSAIIQAILVCIVAGDKNLILHTPEEDVGLVVRLTFWVSLVPFLCDIQCLFRYHWSIQAYRLSRGTPD